MVLGSFAVTTMLTKNAFLEEIRKQYVLTARAKGLSSGRCCGSTCSATR
jgi:microcin C transport system permease protein